MQPGHVTVVGVRLVVILLVAGLPGAAPRAGEED